MANNKRQSGDAGAARNNHDPVDRRRYELEALRSFNDRLANIFDVERAIQSLDSYLGEIMDFKLAVYLVADQTGDDLIYKAYAREKPGPAYLDSARRDMSVYLRAKTDKVVAPAVAIVENLKPDLGGGQIDNRRKGAPGSHVILPLELGEESLGLIYLASDKKEMYKSGADWLVDAILVTFILFVVRLRTLYRAQHSRTESLVESLGDGIIMFNEKRNIILMNPSARDFTGSDPDNFTLGDLARLFSGVDVKGLTEKAVKRGAVSRVTEIRLEDRYFELIFTPVHSSRDRRAHNGAVILRDISQLKEVDKIKTEFVYIVSHQLRTPLTGIRWFTELLLKGKAGELTAKQRDFLRQIELSNRMMIKLVNSLLDVSRLETGNKFTITRAPTDLCELVEQVIDDNIALIDSSEIKISKKYELPDGFKANIDKEKIKQVIHNLVNNAVKYSDAGGNVEIKAALKDRERMVISVRDHGIGIPGEKQQRIFERFYRAEEAASRDPGGTGLGLYVARGIIRAHRGRIWLESEPGKGSTFFVELPVK